MEEDKGRRRFEVNIWSVFCIIFMTIIMFQSRENTELHMEIMNYDFVYECEIQNFYENGTIVETTEIKNSCNTANCEHNWRE